MNLTDIAIIIPSLNPDEKFSRVVDGMRSAGFSCFVFVDDGSDAEHKGPFKEACKYPGTHLLIHERNKGKGQALKDAFKFVLDNLPEIDGVITIDGDGQHRPEDALKLAESLQNHPDRVVFGCRKFNLPNVPTHNRLGNKITSAVFRLLFGLKLSDAQTGLRGISRKYLKAFAEEVEGTRFEYESNVLIYMTEQNIPFCEVPIETVYLEDNKSSHFRVVRDSIRIYKPIISKSKSLKFVICSGLSALFELVLFTILNSVFLNIATLWLQTFLTTGLSRILSACFNFTLNKTIVFKNKGSVKKTGLKYLILALCIYGSSYLLCLLFFSLLLRIGEVGFVRTIIKLFVDLLLFFVSFFVQKKWVFKEEKK